MAILETLTISFAPIVAKSILALWLNSENFATDAASDMIGLVKEATTNIRAQQRMKREFEEIGETVADFFVKFLEVEARGLPEHSQNSVVESLTDTIKNVHIDAKLLVQINLNSTALYQHLVEKYPIATDLMNENEHTLYEQMLKKSCEHIVQIATGLPQFSEHGFAEVLEREDQIISIMKKIACEIREIYENAIDNNPNIAFARLENDYLYSVRSQLGHLELIGIGRSVVGRRYLLDSAYVSLQLIPINLSTNFATRSISSMTTFQALKTSRVVIQGEAGSGKTTLIQWIAVRAVTNTFPPEMQGWQGCIPFLFRLRQFNGMFLPEAKDFIKAVNPLLGGNNLEPWVLNHLTSGNSIVLIDGVDELARDQRDNFIDWLQGLIDLYPLVRYVVTSRNYAIEQEWFEYQKFAIFKIQRMDMHSTLVFIDRWHNAVRTEVSSQIERIALEHRANIIKKRLLTDRSLSRLMTNPLMCAMICALNRENEDDLPNRRVKLYETVCKIMVESRDKQRKIQSAQINIDGKAINFDLDKRLKVLQVLAAKMVLNRDTEIMAIDAQRTIAKCLRDLRMPDDEATVSAVYKVLTERSGIIDEATLGHMNFMHITFQEYLAAKEHIDENNFGYLVDQAEIEEYTNIIILAAGLANNVQKLDLIERLLTRGSNLEGKGGWFNLLAMASANEMVALPPLLHEKIKSSMYKIKLPFTRLEAERWAIAGPSAIPFLCRTNNIDTASGCIYALALIGGPNALDAIVAYVGIDKLDVHESLNRAQSWFDVHEYVQRVLIHLPYLVVDCRLAKLIEELSNYVPQISLSLKRLSVLHLQQLPFLYSLENLEELLIENWLAATSEELGTLTQLQKLTIISAQHLEDANAISYLNFLKFLDLHDFPVLASLEPIGNLSLLEELHLSQCVTLTSLESLSRLPNLQKLSLNSLPAVENIDFLQHLINLESLVITECPSITGVGILASLRSVKSLELDGIGGQHDLSPIALMEGLEVLILHDTQLIDLTFLADMKKLRFLDVLTPVNKDIAAFLNSLTNISVNFEINDAQFDNIIDVTSSGIDQ